MSWTIAIPIVAAALMLYLGYRNRQAQKKLFTYLKPGHRRCKLCGAEYLYFTAPERSVFEGGTRGPWWEPVQPVGNDPQCACHNYARKDEI